MTTGKMFPKDFSHVMVLIMTEIFVRLILMIMRVMTVKITRLEPIDGVFVGVSKSVNHILIVIGLDMTTVDYLGHHGFWIELKWSPSCLANYGVFHIGTGFPRKSMDVI